MWNRLNANSKELFDKAARKGDSFSVLVPNASRFRNLVLDRAMRKTLTPLLEQVSKLTVLEVGCGIGRWTKIMSEKNSVIGLDISRFMIKQARDSCIGKDCSFVVADVSFLPFKENIFDLIVSITVLQHILEDQKFLLTLQEISRCAKSKVLIVEEMWSTKDTVLKEVYCPIRIQPLAFYVKNMSVAGFHTIQVRGITPATFTILITRYLASKTNAKEDRLRYRFRSSKIVSRLVHSIMGLGTLSAAILPSGEYNPSLSLHTILVAKKQRGTPLTREHKIPKLLHFPR